MPVRHRQKNSEAHQPAENQEEQQQDWQMQGYASGSATTSSHPSSASTLVASPSTAEPAVSHISDAWSLQQLVSYHQGFISSHPVQWKLRPRVFSDHRGTTTLETTIALLSPLGDATETVGILGGEILAVWLAELSGSSTGTAETRLRRAFSQVYLGISGWPENLVEKIDQFHGGHYAVRTERGTIRVHLIPPLSSSEVEIFNATLMASNKPYPWVIDPDDQW